VSTLGNILWFIFFGLWTALYYLVTGALLCLTIVGIPFGMQCFRYASAVLAPFGTEVVQVPSESGPLRMIFNVIWIFLFGWELALAHLASALACAITIIGIPFALQHVKLVPVALLPFGHDLQ